jgi:RES domain-containing protein
MMVEAWRIVPVPRMAEAFTGEGARLFGGRWNSPGVPMVYCSTSISLAALETLVHINPQIPLEYVLYQVQFDRALVETLSRVKCTHGWNAQPPGPASMSVGDRWVRESRSAVLAAPSILTGETSYLLNPKHKDSGRIQIGKPEPFTFDARLLKGT